MGGGDSDTFPVDFCLARLLNGVSPVSVFIVPIKGDEVPADAHARCHCCASHADSKVNGRRWLPLYATLVVTMDTFGSFVEGL